jgi:hypothetical protein
MVESISSPRICPKRIRRPGSSGVCAQARTEAVYAQVSELEARRAELQAQLGPLLARHEQLTRSLPWHEQTVRPQS